MSDSVIRVQGSGFRIEKGEVFLWGILNCFRNREKAIFSSFGAGIKGLKNKGLGHRFLGHFGAAKKYSGFLRVAICASDLQDKELEFFLRRFLKMNYF